MNKLLLVALLAACGDNMAGDDTHEPPGTDIPEVTAGCMGIPGNEQTFQKADGFGPLVQGTLKDWDPNGRWFMTGTKISGVSSILFARHGLQVTVDRDDAEPGAIDDDALFARVTGQDQIGGPLAISLRVSNLRDDGTARIERAVCGSESCTVCTAKLEYAKHNAGEGDGQGISMVGSLLGSDWGPGYTFNVRVVGTLAYLIRQDGLHVIETADPAHPVQLGWYKRPQAGYSNDVKLVQAGDKCYAILADSPVDIVEVTDPTNPHLVATIAVEAHTDFVETRNGRTLVYFGAYNGTTPVYDVTNPVVPVRLGAWDAHSTLVHDLMIDNGIAYLNAWEGGFEVVDFTTPSQPRGLGTWKQTPTHTSHSSWETTVGTRKIALHGEEAYGAHLDVVDVDPASSQFMTSIGTWKTRDYVSIHNLMAFGDRAYMTYYQDGIRILDLSDPTKPKQLAYYNTWDPQADYTSSDFFESAVGLDVDMTRKLIFVADSPRGLLILRDETL